MAKAIDSLENGNLVNVQIQQVHDSKGGKGFWVTIDGIKYACDSAQELKKLISDQFTKAV